MALARCILAKFLGLGYHFFPPPLDFPTFSARCLHVQLRERPLTVKGGTLRGREMFRQIWPRNPYFHVILGIFYMPQICDMGQTALLPFPKEGVLRNFSPLKIGRLRPGLNPRTWVPDVSTLPLDHRSRFPKIYQENPDFIKIGR